MARYIVRHTFYIEGRAYLPYEFIDTEKMSDFNIRVVNDLEKQGSIELILEFTGDISPPGLHSIEGTGIQTEKEVKEDGKNV